MVDQQILSFLHSNVIIVLVVWYFFSAVTSSLPTPTKESSPFYRFLYAFMHTFAGNIAEVGSIVAQYKTKALQPVVNNVVKQ